MLRDQQLDRFLRDGNFTDGVFRFRSGNVRFACVISPCLLADGNGPVFDIQVRLLERDQFTFAQTTNEFQIEHWQDTALIRCGQIGFDLFRR